MTIDAAAHTTKVAILGGGLAGLATAVALVESGFRVTLVESRPILGGRATSFLDSETGEKVDNCQHVTMGCCTNLADFCRRMGIDDLIQQEPVLYFQDEQGRVSPMSASPLPAPLHLAPAFLRATFLSFAEKLRIAYGMWRLLREPSAPAEMSFATWLDRNCQNSRTKERYWGLVLTSALNDSLENIDYRYARQVFVEGFLASSAASVVEIPKVPLGEFYGGRLLEWLISRGVDVRQNVAVAGLEVIDNKVTTCRLKDGTDIVADHYVVAVSFQRVADLLPAAVVEQEAQLKRLGELEHSPITSVHFWFDRPVMDLPHLVPVGRTVQWLFRRVESDSPAAPEHYVQAVVSAARMFQGRTREEIYSQVLADLHAILPKSRAANVLHYRVVTEKQATYAMKPGIDQLRPTQETSVKNLWLAGDYTQTDWPATMEGAVRSGYLAAQGILNRLGIQARWLVPPLPAGKLVRWINRANQ